MLSKKNFKSNCSEIEGILEMFSEGDRVALISALLDEIDFTGRSTAPGKDDQKVCTKFLLKLVIHHTSSDVCADNREAFGSFYFAKLSFHPFFLSVYHI